MRYSRFIYVEDTYVEDTISNLVRVLRANFWGINGFFSFISIHKFDSFKNPFATIISLSEFYFRFRENLSCWYKLRKWFLHIMEAAETDEICGYEGGLTWCLRWATYTSISTWTYLQNSLAAAEALSLKIPSPGNISQVITKIISISTRIVISYAMKRGTPFWVWQKFNGNWS